VSPEYVVNYSFNSDFADGKLHFRLQAARRDLPELQRQPAHAADGHRDVAKECSEEILNARC
jgi:hypothetical protein